MISDLRNLAMVQEAYAVDHHQYATPQSDGTIINVRGEVRWRPSANISVDPNASVTIATATGWRAQLVRRGTDQRCVVAGGDLSSPGDPAAADAGITCTRASDAITMRGRSGGGAAAGTEAEPPAASPPEAAPRVP